MLDGNMRVLDMILTDLDQSKGTTYIIRTKADIPSKPTPGKVAFFLDMEGGGGPPDQSARTPVPARSQSRDIAELFPAGVRGLQLTHNGRNQLGDGAASIRCGQPADAFRGGRREGNEPAGHDGRSIAPLHGQESCHAAEISKTPIVSTHQNLEQYVKSRPPGGDHGRRSQGHRQDRRHRGRPVHP